MRNFLAAFCDDHLSLFIKQGPNLCTGTDFSHGFPRSIDHFLSLGALRRDRLTEFFVDARRALSVTPNRVLHGRVSCRNRARHVDTSLKL